MVGLKRREDFSNPICQRLKFDDVKDMYLQTSSSFCSAITHRTKSVHFSNVIQIKVIPNRYEYSEAGVIMWWSQYDLQNFRRDYFLSLSSSTL
jgi:hypothetical protein